MPSLTGNVGENEANALHDVALVQAMFQATGTRRASAITRATTTASSGPSRAAPSSPSNGTRA